MARIRPKHAAAFIRVVEMLPMLHLHNKNNHLKVELKGAEIGVAKGAMSAALLEYFPKLHLTMVDSWEPWTDPADHLSKITQKQQDAHRRAAEENTAFASDRREILHARSQTASEMVEDASLDFVFIDGDHTEDGVSMDIHHWWPKVRVGGILAGHDYNSKRLQGVTKAVNAVMHLKKMPLLVAPYRVWWTVKGYSHA